MTATVTYQGGLRCEAMHTQSGSQIETDAPTDNHGQGARFSPTDLTCTSLATCIITTMAIKATGMGIELAGATAMVQKYMSKDAPRRIVQIDVAVQLPAMVIDDKDKAVLESTGHACPVARSLHPDVKQVISFNWS